MYTFFVVKTDYAKLVDNSINLYGNINKCKGINDIKGRKWNEEKAI